MASKIPTMIEFLDNEWHEGHGLPGPAYQRKYGVDPGGPEAMGETQAEYDARMARNNKREADEKTQAAKRLEFCQREYFRLRNGQQRFMRCPYCTEKATKRNFPNMPYICCPMFARVFKAILDRQDKLDAAAQIAAENAMRKPLVEGYVN